MTADRLIERAKDDESGQWYFLLGSLLISYMAYEGYVNYVGKVLFPETWKNERDYFSRRNGYPGLTGKLKWLFERTGVHRNLDQDRRYTLIEELRELRDKVAHAKPEFYSYERIQPVDADENQWDVRPWLGTDITVPYAEARRQAIKEFVIDIHTDFARYADSQSIDALDFSRFSFEGSLSSGFGSREFVA